MVSSRSMGSLICLLTAMSPSAAAGLVLIQPAEIPAAGSPSPLFRSPGDSSASRRVPRASRAGVGSRALVARSAVSDAFRNADPERSRRDLLRVALAVPAGALALSSKDGGIMEAPSTPGPKVTPLPSVGAALDLIEKSCNRRFLHAVVASDYNFLYRGLPTGGVDARSPTVRVEPCDLLDPATYGSEEAAAFFRELDGRMKSNGSPVLPSNGHLGVTCPEAAAEWGGVAASVWPLGGEDDVHFAWFESGGEFWPRPSSAAAGSTTAESVIIDGIDCGRLSLDDALVGDRWEVLFRADRFLTVPVAFEAELRKGLRHSFII